MRKPTIRRQSPVKGGRTPLPACVIHDIWQRVQREARTYGVSRSWVIAVRLAESFGILDSVEHYANPEMRRKRVR
jgi:hypothetical protein